MKNKIVLFLLLISSLAFGQVPRVFTGKCNISQTGSGAGYWQVGVTNFDSPGGVYDAGDITVNDKLYFNDSGILYTLNITTIVSASGTNATIRVSNVGVTGISSVPTSAAEISRGTANYKFVPWTANMTDNDNQIVNEHSWYLADSLLAIQAAKGNITQGTLVAASASRTVPMGGQDLTFDNASNIRLRASGEYYIGNGSGDLPTLNSDDTNFDLGLGASNELVLSQKAADQVLSKAGAPVNGTDIAWYVGQLLVNTVDGSVYRAATKSSNPDFSGVGSTWTQVANIADGDINWNEKVCSSGVSCTSDSITTTATGTVDTIHITFSSDYGEHRWFINSTSGNITLMAPPDVGTFIDSAEYYTLAPGGIVEFSLSTVGLTSYNWVLISEYPTAGSVKVATSGVYAGLKKIAKDSLGLSLGDLGSPFVITGTDRFAIFDPEGGSNAAIKWDSIVKSVRDSVFLSNQISKRTNKSIGLGNITDSFSGSDVPTSNVTIPIGSVYTRFGNSSANNILYLWGGTNPGAGFGTTTTSANYPYQFGLPVYCQSLLGLGSNLKDNRDNTLLSQSGSGVATNRDFTMGNGTYSRAMFQANGYYFYRSGIFPVIGTYSFAAHGGTSQALNQNGLSIRLRPESPGWSNTNPTNGGDIFLDLPLGVKGGLHGGFYVRTTTTGDTTQVNLLTYMQDSLLKMPQYASLSFVTNYRGILATTSTGKVVLADKDVVMGGIVGINSQTGTSYTLGISDVGKTISMTNASANAVTVPPNSSVAFGVGTKITVYQGGSGITSFVAGSGVTINSADSALNLRTIYSTATLTKTGTNSWLLAGDIIP